VKITIQITPGIIACLFTSAIEGGDPVTTASRGGWCDGIYCPKAGDRWEYDAPNQYEKAFTLKVVEVDDETTGHKTTHTVRMKHVRKGLEIMAKDFPEQFAQVVRDDIDAPCADLFLQCVLFGDEKYA